VRQAILVIHPQSGEARVHTISREQTLIGRGAHSEITLQDTGTSREHAVITWDGDHYTIEDLQSTNGTKVNERRIRSAKLEANDRIQIGRTTLVFRWDEPSEDTVDLD
jgi:pSer/pThr/pTyr-binding forkhead associated (FHA) protein